jgi:hypothetical protein
VSAPPSPTAGSAEGERLRDESLTLLRLQRAFLTFLLDHGSATTDAVGLAVPMPPGIDPRCVGAAVRGLETLRLIRKMRHAPRPIGPPRGARPRPPEREITDRPASLDWLAAHPELPDPEPPRATDAVQLPTILATNEPVTDLAGLTWETSSMSERKKLSDILGAGNGGNFRNIWNSAVAADDFKPLPPDEYVFRILTGELFTSKKGTPGYKLTLEVAEGEHEGRRVWHDLWLTAAALPMAKRDLAKIGVTDPEQLEQPLPPGILIRGKLVIHRDDDGNEVNKLRYFECAGIEPGDAFEPKDGDQADAKPPEAGGTPAAAEGGGGQTGELFPFGANANGEGDADQRAKDFLNRERGGRP